MAVRLEKLRLDTLGTVDARIEKLFQKHLAHIVRDCEDRPSDTGERTITLQFAVTPCLNPDTRECDEVGIAIQCKSSVPKFHTKPFQMRVEQGSLLFNADAPDALRQQILPTDDE